MKTAAKKPKVVWSGVMLEDPQQLLSWWVNNVGPLLKKTFAHHMTIKFKPSPEEVDSLPIGRAVPLRVDGVVQDEHCQAVRVRGYTSSNPVAHITVATDGTSPAYSKKLLQSGDVKDVDGPSLPGKVGVSMSNGEIIYAFPRTAKHDPSRNDYQNKYQTNRYHERKKMAIDMLGGKCSVCSTTRNLELDHKNPATKSFTITKLWSVPEAEFKKEVKKCRLLCHKHHLENSAKQREKGQVKSVPGKSKYDSKNRKKASKGIDRTTALGISKQIAGRVGDKADCSVYRGSDFDKGMHIDAPVLVWDAHDVDGGGQQIIVIVYGREKDLDLVKQLVGAVKHEVESASSLDYVDDRKEPGLLAFAVSGTLH